MADELKQQIIEYIFGHQDVPAHIMDEFSRWLLEHEGDPETESIMLEKWEEYSRTLFISKSGYIAPIFPIVDGVYILFMSF